MENEHARPKTDSGRILVNGNCHQVPFSAVWPCEGSGTSIPSSKPRALPNNFNHATTQPERKQRRAQRGGWKTGKLQFANIEWARECWAPLQMNIAREHGRWGSWGFVISRCRKISLRKNQISDTLGSKGASNGSAFLRHIHYLLINRFVIVRLLNSIDKRIRSLSIVRPCSTVGFS